MEHTIISSLELAPSKEKETLELIERCFAYSKQNSFAIDFYPLMQKNNHQNCFILLENNIVVAHIAALPVRLKVNNKFHDVLFLGGICVEIKSQGKGYFKKLYQFVEDQFKEQSLYFLWSEKVDLYNKFGYYPAIAQYQYPQIQGDTSTFIKTSLQNLSEIELEQIQKLYSAQGETRVFRDKAHWNCLKHITSAELFIKKIDQTISNYFFKNKGEDLKGIIHEYGIFNEIELKQIRHYGVVWSSQAINQLEYDVLFGSLVKIGHSSTFSDFVSNYTNNKFQIEKVDKKLVHFSFGKNCLSMSHKEFLQGLLGPGIFEELDISSPIFISGLDSI